MKANKKRNRLFGLLMTLAMLLVLLPTTTLAANAPSSIVFTGVGTEERVGLNEDRGFYLVNGAAASSGTLGEGGCTAYYDKAAGTLYLSGFTGKVVSLDHTGDAEVKINLSGENNIEWINGNAGSGTTIEITSSDGGTLNVSKTGDGNLVGIDAGSTKGKVVLSGSATVNVTLKHLTEASGNYATGIYALEGIEIKDAASFSAVLNAKTKSSNRVYGLNVKNSSPYDIVINTTGTVDIDCSSDTSPYTYPIFNNTGSGKKVDLQNVGRMTLKYRQYSLYKESSPEITYPSTLERTSTTTSTTPAITTVTYAPPSAKTDPTITADPTASPITYGQTLANSTLSGGAASVEGTFAWKTPTTAPQVSDSNSTEYEVIFTPTDTEHYNTVTCQVKLKVNPKEITVKVAEIPAQLYTGSQIKPAITVTDGAGTTTLTEGTDYTVTYGNNINKPTGTVTVNAATNGNYKFTNVVKNFDITNGQLTVTILGDYDETYDGSAVRDHSVLVKNTINTELRSSDYTVIYTYYICQDTPGDITTETTTANSGAESTGGAPKYAGNYVVKATVTAENYETAVGSKAFNIAKADSVVRNVSKSHPETIDTNTYLFNIQLAGNCTPEGTLKLVSGQTLTVGTHDYNWEFTPNDTRNYNTATGTIRLTVEEAADPLESISVTGTPTKTVYKYGEPFETAGLTVTATYESGRTENVTSQVTFGALAVGQSTIELSYGGRTVTIESLTVNPAPLTITAKDQSIYVNGTAPDLSNPVEGTHYTITGLVGDDTIDGITMEYQRNGAAVTPDATQTGTYDIVISDAGNNDNYEFVFVPGTLTISERSSGTITIIVPSTEETKPADQENPTTGAAVSGSSIGYACAALAAVGAIYVGAKKLAKKDEE